MKPIMYVNKQQGSSMIEVVVAMLLLGICVIGFAALQMRAITAGGEAAYRGQAMSIARELAERVRLNYTSGALTEYQKATNWSAPPTFTDCGAGACSSTQLAIYDINSISTMASNTLPNGKVSLLSCPSSYKNVCIYVAWNNTSASNGGGSNECAGTDGKYILSTNSDGVTAYADCVMVEVVSTW